MTIPSPISDQAGAAIGDPISHERAFHIALVLEMSELSDRNSPEDDPSTMVADSNEMAGCIERALERADLVLVPPDESAPIAFYRDVQYEGSHSGVHREYNGINEFSGGGTGFPLYAAPQTNVQAEHSAIYISKRLTSSDADASFVQAHINQAVSEAMEAASPAASVLTDAQVGRNLEGLREQLLAPRGIVRNPEGWPVHAGARDSSGWLFHPAIPVCDEGTRIDKLLEAFGIETSFVTMESDTADFYDRWCEEGLSDCSSWVPTPPTGDGWLLLEIYDTEDGPCALFGRGWYEAEKVRKQAERAERRDANRIRASAPREKTS
jgi:hypothetical protein